jgi:tripartite ATP-independent transporter DctP family solute receptor
MTPRKLSLALAAVSLVASALVALAASGEHVGAQDRIQMKIATVAPEGTPWEKQLKSFKRYVEEGSQNRIQVKVFMGGSLGGEKALVRRTSQGSLQVFGGSAAAVGSMVPELDVIEAPYLFESAEAADRVLDRADTKQMVEGLLAKRGFTFGFWAENGFRSWYTKEKQIRTPADLRGLRMRSQESPVHLETYRAFGASPVPIDVTNVLTSLQTGVVDGFDNTPLFSFATSWYQGARFLTLSEHCYQPGIVVYSKTWFDGLPPDLQRLLRNVPESMVAEGRTSVRRMDPVLLQNLEQRAGIRITRLDPAQKAAFAQVARPVAERIAAKAGAGARALLQALRRR